MLCKRIIPCLDVDAGRTVKGVKFQNLRDIGDPVELAGKYQDQGADELVFLDISATNEGRETMLDVVEKIADVLMMPFTVGGGIDSYERVKRLLERGADKVSVNTAAVLDPGLIDQIAYNSGSQCCILAVDAKKVSHNKWQVLTNGGRKETGIDALSWAKEAVKRGAGEILLTSWDKDGTMSGFDMELIKIFSEELSVPVIASGGASSPEDFYKVFTEGKADAALAASIFHDSIWTVSDIKKRLREKNVEVRL
jgi:cyclase